MDIKIKGITPKLLTKRCRSQKGALFILDMIREIIPAPRPELKPHAPAHHNHQEPVDKIGAIIGPGARSRAIQEETGAKIDIDDDGTVFIVPPTASRSGSPRAHRGAVEVPQLGRIYTARWCASRFRRLRRNPSQHRRNGAHFAARQRTRREVEDVVAMGDEITVMVTGIDDAARSACHGRPCSRLDAEEAQSKVGINGRAAAAWRRQTRRRRSAFRRRDRGGTTAETARARR